MSFLLLLLEIYPDLTSQINDLWFGMHELPPGDKERAERYFIGTVGMMFKDKGDEIRHQRHKWEIKYSMDEVKLFLDTFYEQLK